MQRILVVEDDFDIQELLQNFLQEAGYEVAVANDGVEALSLFAGQRYDLIVLDIMLPKIDGYGVCELIRKQSDVPIIVKKHRRARNMAAPVESWERHIMRAHD